MLARCGICLKQPEMVHVAQNQPCDFVQSCHLRQTGKTFKKAIDKRGAKCYNMQAVKQLGCHGAGDREQDSAQEITKKVEKTFEKVLDKVNRM